MLPDGRVVTGGPAGGCWCGTRPSRATARPSSAATRARWGGGGAAGRAGGHRRLADGRVLVWDPAEPGGAPAELGRHDGRCGRWRCCRTGGWSPAATTGGCWCGTRPSPAPPRLELGRHDGGVRAVAVLPDGRVVTGGTDQRVLVWDPAEPSGIPAELGRSRGGLVRAVAALADGRIVTGGGDRRVLVWDPGGAGIRVVQLSCSVSTLTVAPLAPSRSNLIIAHEGTGFSLWSLTG